jgi:hypothetical protein
MRRLTHFGGARATILAELLLCAAGGRKLPRQEAPLPLQNRVRRVTGP